MERAILNRGEDNEFECKGFKRHLPKTVITHIISILTFGIPYLIGHWKPDWKINWFNKSCPLAQADKVVVTPIFGNESSTTHEITKVALSNDLSTINATYIHHERDADSNITSEDEEGLTDRTRLITSPAASVRYFEYRHARYIWNASEETYTRLYGLDKGHPINKFTSDYMHGLTKEEQVGKRTIFGRNSVDVEVKSYATLFVQEVFHPFYVFQIGSIILWSVDEYMYYASCIFAISMVSIIVSLIEIRRQNQALHDMVASSNNTKVRIIRAESRNSNHHHYGSNQDVSANQQRMSEEIKSTELVPGDVIEIPANGCLMACDAVLVTGTCIVNESMLTGESVPVTKAALSQGEIEPTHNDLDSPDGEDNIPTYDPETYKRNTLFAGTSVIQTRFYGNAKVLAVVVRTGFETARGDLIRSILFPKPMDFKFYRDSMRFIMLLFGIAAVGMCYCVYVYINRGSLAGTIIKRCLDIITIVVPPALPAAMTVGTYYAQNRLKKASIFCISPQRINVCGKLKLICFDKTGTLTEDGLDMWGVVPTLLGYRSDDADVSISSNDSSYQSNRNNFRRVQRNVEYLPLRSPVLTCLASCHSLTLIDNELIGDPLDIKMFQSTTWELEESGKSDCSKFDMLMPTIVKPKSHAENPDSSFDPFDPNILRSDYPIEVGIIRQFSFSSNVARMSVITRALGDTSFHVYTKGAPEKLEELCNSDSIPEDFHLQLKHYATQGYRVIGLAHRVLPSNLSWHKIQKLKRHQVEADLTFLGLLIMQNTLKPETTPVIQELKSADIRTVMVTGDNLLTAISVARDCKMIKSKDRVIVVEATPPTSYEPSGRLHFNYSDDSNQQNDSPSNGRHLENDNNNELLVMERAINNDAQVQNIEEGRRQIDQNYHFAMSGQTWGIIKTHFSHILPKLILKGSVFARMAPDQKAQLVEELQSIDYVVSMCGDGANDCGALKAAHVGISLSEAEASVAAPFTSTVPNITCVPQVIKEGRCALVTSFGVFKYMALYSMVQFVSVLLLYSLQTNLGDAQFLYIDLAITATVAVCMGWTGPYHKLASIRPPGSLVSGPNLFSIFSQIGLTILSQVGAYLYLRMMPWFKPVHPPTPETEITLCAETTTIFLISSFQYLVLAAAFSRGPPYRKAFYTNIPFAISLIVLAGFTCLLVIYPGNALANFFQIDQKLTWSFKIALLVMSIGYAFVCVFIEKIIVPAKWLKRLSHFILGKKEPKNKFKIIQYEMEKENWPPQNYNGDDISRSVVHICPGIS